MTDQDIPELQEALATLKNEASKAINTVARYQGLVSDGDSVILPPAAKARWLTRIGQHATVLQQAYNTAKEIYQR